MKKNQGYQKNSENSSVLHLKYGNVMKQIINKKMISVFSAVKGPYLLFLIRSTSGLLNVISQTYIRSIPVRYFVSIHWLGIPSFNSPFYWLIKPLPCRLFKIDIYDFYYITDIRIRIYFMKVSSFK